MILANTYEPFNDYEDDIPIDAPSVEDQCGGTPAGNHVIGKSVPDPDGQPPVSEVNEADDDPHRLARIFLDAHCSDDGWHLRYYREEYHEWNGAAYAVVPAKELRARMCERIKHEFDRLARIAAQKWEANGGKNENDNRVPKPVAKKVSTKAPSRNKVPFSLSLVA
jgi:hypothetical protein